MKTLMTDEERRELFIRRLQTFCAAAHDLAEAWHEESCNAYPLNESFDEFCMTLSRWRAACEFKHDVDEMVRRASKRTLERLQ